MSKLRGVLAIVLAIGVGAAATAAALAQHGTTNDGNADADAEQRSPATATVETRDLSRNETLSGTLTYQDARTLSTRLEGTVTGLPAVGETLSSGDVLAWIDDEPIILLHGDVPAWRDLDSGAWENGRDIKQLEEALLALGYGEERDTFPDDDWDWRTTEAVRELQEDLDERYAEVDIATDGALPLGTVVFIPDDVRVTGQEAIVGDQIAPGQPLVSVSGHERLVTVDLDPTDRRLVSEGSTVEVELPTGERVLGTIDSIGTRLESDPGGNQVIKVEVLLDDASAAEALNQAPVTVRIATTIAEGAVSVPVLAVVGTPGGSYAVDVVQPDGSVRRVPVELGAWGDGYVEISGDVAAGDEVVVPE